MFFHKYTQAAGWAENVHFCKVLPEVPRDSCSAGSGSRFVTFEFVCSGLHQIDSKQLPFKGNLVNPNRFW